MKAILKIAFFYAMERLGVNAYFRYRNKGRVKVLLFHSISTPGRFFGNAVSADNFGRQLHYLSKHYAILTLTQDGQFFGYDSTKINVLLTFDDGFLDNYTVAAPMLALHNMSAVFFVIAECLPDGRPPSFIVKRLGEQSKQDAYRTLAIAQAKELMTMGMAIGSHGVSHSDYSTMSVETAAKDAAESKTTLEAAIGVPIASFAFPWGKFQEGQANTLERIYRRIFTTKHGFNAIDDFVFHRNEVTNLPHLCCTASGALDYFSALVGWRLNNYSDSRKNIK